MRRPWSYLLPLALAALLGGYGLLGLQSFRASAQMAPAGKGRASKDVKRTAAADKKDAQAPDSDEEGSPEQVLKRLMERREAVQGRTLRGQTIADAPPFRATTREEHLEFFPCSDCHADQVTNRHVRKLTEEHEVLDFQHGGGRFWCYDACHNPKDMDHLVSLHGEPIGFDESYKLCGQCHFQRQKDWYFGGHGKRAGSFEIPREVPAEAAEIDFSDREKIGTWQGERVIHICTDCHDAHSPSIKAYEPSPPPKVRRGLTRQQRHEEQHLTLWQMLSTEHAGDK
jgi:hypothetical protein